MLHVTTGDSAVERLRAAGVSGDVLPWRDALHEGPVPEGLDPAHLRAERARFLAGRGWGDEQAIAAEMTRRDERLSEALARSEEIRAAAPAPFDGSPYKTLWRAFTAPDPRGLARIDAPPVVRDAARRQLQQFPWRGDGLNRTERALPHAIIDGASTPAEAVFAQQRQEERPFLGDAIAFDYLAALPRGDEARAILAGEREWHRRPERWLGGVRLPAGGSPWRYDPDTGRVG